MKITRLLSMGLPMGVYPHASTSFGFPSDASETAGLRCVQSEHQTLSRVHDCSSCASVPLMF